MESVQDNKMEYFNYIHEKLSWLVVKVESGGYLNLTDQNMYAEGFYAKFLNLLFDWELYNENGVNPRAQGIDLIDSVNRIIVQVSSKKDHHKVQDSLNKCDLEQYNGYHFYFVAIVNDVDFRKGFIVPSALTFDYESDVFSIKELLNRVLHAEIEKTKALYELVKKHFGDTSTGIELTLYIPRINRCLADDRSYSPSFKLMRGFDRELSPKGIIQNKNRTIIFEEDKMTFKEFIEKNWRERQKHHLFIKGVGGVGKTVALLTLDSEVGFLPEKVAVVYIPLRKMRKLTSPESPINDYLKTKFSHDEYNAIEQLSKIRWTTQPHLLLLLDGYNEIPAGCRSDVDKELESWEERPGVQIITTSRIEGCFKNGRFDTIELLELDRPTVEKYLIAHTIDVPKENDPLWDVITTPLMLNLYTDVASYKNDLPYKQSDNAGHLIWNWLLKELDRCMVSESDQRKRACISALMLTAPYVAWRMEQEHLFELTKETLGEWIDEGFDYWNNRQLEKKIPKYISVLQLWLHQDTSSMEDQGINQGKILTEQTGLFMKLSSGEYTLMHQSFRDALAAIHLLNLANVTENKLPDEFREPFSEYVVGFLADLDDGELMKLWEVNRQENPTPRIPTDNLLRVLHKRNRGNLESLNWGSMDLRSINLFRFRAEGMHMLLSKIAANFDKTKLYADCFRPEGHTGAIHTIAFNHDAEVFATGAGDGIILLWDAKTYQQLNTPLKGHKRSLTSVAFSPDGHFLVSGARDGTIRLWDTRTRTQIGDPLLDDSNSIISCVALSRNGILAAALVSKNKPPIILLDITNHRQIGSLPGHNGSALKLAFNPEGTILASCSDDKSIRLWDMNTLTQIGDPLTGHNEKVISITFSPDGKTLASGSEDRTIRLWNVQEQRQIGDPLVPDESIKDKNVYSVAFSKDGNVLASGMSEGTIILWNLKDRQQIGKPLMGHKNKVYALAFSGDSNVLASGSRDNTVCFWDTISHTTIRKPLSAEIGRVNFVAFNKDDTSLAFGTRDGDIFTWDVNSEKPESRRAKYEQGEADSDIVSVVAFDHTGKINIIASTDYQDGKTINIWKLNTSERFLLPGHSGQIRTLAISPDGTILASGAFDNTVRLWDVKTCKPIGKPLAGHEKWISSLAFNATGTVLASGSDDQTIRLWDVKTQELIGEPLKGHSGFMNALAFSPDGTVLASGSVDGSIRCWELDQDGNVHKAREPLGEDLGIINTLAFNPNGSILASGSFNGSILLWDVKEYTADQLDRRAGDIKALGFSKNGHFLAVGTHDGAVSIWDWRKKKCLKTHHELPGIDISGLNFSRAVLTEEDKKILRQNGAITE